MFAEFIPIMLHILKPVAAEALFAWVYGSFNGTGAAILRKARPDQLTYEASLQRIGGNPSWIENAIVVRVKM